MSDACMRRVREYISSFCVWFFSVFCMCQGIDSVTRERERDRKVKEENTRKKGSTQIQREQIWITLNWIMQFDRYSLFQVNLTFDNIDFVYQNFIVYSSQFQVSFPHLYDEDEQNGIYTFTGALSQFTFERVREWGEQNRITCRQKIA